MMMIRRFMLFVLFVFAGCWREAEELGDFDSDDARHVLVDVLDAWKAGQANALASREPPLHFVDDDCVAGWQLTEYTFETPGEPIYPFADVRVNLTLRDGQKTVERKVAYQVSVSPSVSVLR